MSDDGYTVRLRVRQEIDYEFDFTLEPSERAEFEQWSDGEDPTPALIADFLGAGPQIDFAAYLSPDNAVSEFTGDIEGIEVSA